MKPVAICIKTRVGVVLEARRIQNVKLVYGARHGERGIVDENFVDLTQETSHNLEAVARTPASALGSTRDKPDLKYCQEIFKVLKAHEIEHFFYIGGNDSSDTVRIVSEAAVLFHAGQRGRLGGDPAHRLLFGRLRAAAATRCGWQDAHFGRRVHLGQRHRCDRCLPPVPAPAAGL